MGISTAAVVVVVAVVVAVVVGVAVVVAVVVTVGVGVGVGVVVGVAVVVVVAVAVVVVVVVAMTEPLVTPGDVAFWNTKANDFDRWVSDPNISTSACVEALIGPLLAARPGVVVEVGCGTGRLVWPLAFLLRHHVLVGVDISPAMLAVAQYRRRPFPVAWCTPTNMPRSFTAAYSCQVFQHLPFEEVVRWFAIVWERLVPGGVFRFQYVPGTYVDKQTKHYQHDPEQILKALEFQTFEVLSVDDGKVSPTWQWITVRKVVTK